MLRSSLFVLAVAVSAAAQIEASDQPVADRFVLGEVFGENGLSTNVRVVMERAVQLEDDERYRFLSDWVLPGVNHRSLRLVGEFTETHPIPDSKSSHPLDEQRMNAATRDGESRVEVGGQLVAPAYELVDTAVRLGRLDQLRKKIATYKPQSEEQERARYAFLFLIEAARQEYEAAEVFCEELLLLCEKNTNVDYESKWPETLVACRGLRNPATRTIVSELCSHLFSLIATWPESGSIAWEHKLASLYGFQQSLEMRPERSEFRTPATVTNWIPGSLFTAASRGAGQPVTHWYRNGTRIDKLSPHGIDLLYYRLPLTGDVDIECEATVGAMQNTGLMFGGYFYALFSPKVFDQGTIRRTERVALDEVLTTPEKWARLRIRVRDRHCTTYFNGQKIGERELPQNHDPWLAVYTHGRHQGAVRDVRITKGPAIPDVVQLVCDQELIGWLPYFDERVDTDGNGGSWRYRDYLSGGGIFGRKQPALTGSFKESLLRYHRPIAEDGVIEYEFFYVPGQAVAHPALDRLAFLLDPDGVKVHWITNGRFDRSERDPQNWTVEQEHRRGQGGLPLRANDWNRMRLTLRGDRVELRLNSRVIYDRPLEATNQRTFGLFHYEDRTELRARNLVFRGDWGKSVPPEADQELAGETGFPQQELAELPAVFSHNFKSDGFPTRFFIAADSPNGELVEQKQGLFTSVAATGQWTSMNFLPRFAIHGDFDIEVEFDQLQVQGEKSAGLILHVEVTDEQRHHYRTLRMNDSAQREQLHGSLTLLRPDGSRTYESPWKKICEARSGRLRLARYGTTIYHLFAEGDSSVFQVIGAQPASKADTTRNGVVLRTMCNGLSSASVVWKSITIRSTGLTWYPPAEERPVPKLAVMNVDGSNIRKITAPPDGFTHLGSPEWSADGKTITFDASRGSTRNSHVYRVNSGGTRLWDSGPGCMPSFSPDAKRIVQTQPGHGIVLMNFDGTDRQDIARAGWGAQWSPDGRYIAWGQRGNIIVMNVVTEEQTPLLVGDQADMFTYTYWNLGWSHDSRSIAFKARNRQTGGEDIVVADVDSPDGFQVMHASSKSVHPDFSFSKDNKRVFFAMNDADNIPRLHFLDRGRNIPPQQVPGLPLDWKVFNGDVSPDGSQIVFTGEQIVLPIKWPVGSAPGAASR